LLVAGLSRFRRLCKAGGKVWGMTGKMGMYLWVLYGVLFSGLLRCNQNGRRGGERALAGDESRGAKQGTRVCRSLVRFVVFPARTTQERRCSTGAVWRTADDVRLTVGQVRSKYGRGE